MFTYSQFQQQYPLSPRKFWKKIFGDLVGVVIFMLISIVGTIVISGVFNADSSSSGGINGVVFSWFGAITLFLIMYLIAKAIYVKAYIRRYYYDCNESFVTIKKHVFTPTEIHVQYQKIQDVYVDQDLLDRIMGLYDVHIASATVTSGIEAHIDGVDRQAAEGIKNFLLEKIKTGGVPPATSSATSQNSSLQNLGGSRVSFDRHISSAEYPILGKWLVSAAISSVFSSLLFYIFIFWYFFSKTADSLDSLQIIIYSIIYFSIAIFGFIWKVLWKNSYRFEFMPEYILLRDGVISKEERHLPYRSIQNVTLKQGVVDRVLGIGSVSIENAANQGYGGAQNFPSIPLGKGIMIPGQSIEKANELLGILNGIISKSANPAGMGL